MVERARQAFNPREQAALALLAGSLAIGWGVACVDSADPQRFADFRVLKGAFPVPPPVAAAGPSSVTPSVPDPGGTIDLNLASAGQLETLPTIGPVTAERIVAYRRQHGEFSAVDDLLRVRGIGLRTLERLRPLLRVRSPIELERGESVR